MTAHDKNLPKVSNPEPDTASGPPVAQASRDRATIVVWRLAADVNADAGPTTPTPDDGDSPLTPRLARQLVAIYSDVHGTVLDFDADPHLRNAAESSGRAYGRICDSVDSHGGVVAGPAALVVMRWPRPTTPARGSGAGSLLRRCQRHLASDGDAIIVTAAVGGADETSYSDYERTLLPAAEAAGLQHLHDIVPLDAEDGRDSFTYTTGHRETAPTIGDDLDTVRQTAVTTLMIFGHSGRRP